MATEHSAPGRRATLVRLVDVIVDGGAWLSALAVVLIMILVCLEVVARQVFNTSTMVADELGAYLNAAIIFLGAAYTLREGGFIRVEAIYDRVGEGMRRLIDLFCSLVSLSFVLITVWFMIEHVRYAYQHNTRAVTVLQTSEYLPQSLMVIGSILMALQLLVIVFKPPKRVAQEFL
jgi:TRAP-type C4-dicarboxylate transport system permease small subunit